MGRALLALVLVALVAVAAVGLPFFIELPLAVIGGLFVLTLLPRTSGRSRVLVVIALVFLAAVVVESTLLGLSQLLP